MCEARWVEKHSAFNDLSKFYEIVIYCLENIESNHDSEIKYDTKSVTEAAGICEQLRSAVFIVAFHWLVTNCKKFPIQQLHAHSNNRNTRTRCEICSRLTIKTPERRHWSSSGTFIVNFEHILQLVLVFLLLTLSR